MPTDAVKQIARAEVQRIVASMSSDELALFRAMGGDAGRAKGQVIGDLHQVPARAHWRDVFTWNSGDIEPLYRQRRELQQEKRRQRTAEMAAAFAEYQRRYRRGRRGNVKRRAA